MENTLMRRAILATPVLVGLGSILLTAVPARAAEYGAIAWDKQTGKRGWSWNQPTQKRADEAALGECGASGCKVIIRAGSGKDRDAARLASLKDCEKGKAGECIVRFTDCNK
jgi:hypothetical protein